MLRGFCLIRYTSSEIVSILQYFIFGNELLLDFDGSHVTFLEECMLRFRSCDKANYVIRKHILDISETHILVVMVQN